MSLVKRSGYIFRVLGMPARKLWQLIASLPATKMSERSADKVLLSTALVRFFPELHLKTGSDSSVFP
ncbi:MAG: hypothetical protein ACK56F_07610 [bacterium]